MVGVDLNKAQFDGGGQIEIRHGLMVEAERNKTQFDSGVDRNKAWFGGGGRQK